MTAVEKDRFSVFANHAAKEHSSSSFAFAEASTHVRIKNVAGAIAHVRTAMPRATMLTQVASSLSYISSVKSGYGDAQVHLNMGCRQRLQ